MTVAALAVIALAVAGCGGDDGDDAATTATTAAGVFPPTSPPASGSPGCGLSLADVQALLPPSSGVTENSTPDSRRCNFTWDDGGPRGIDVAVLPGALPAFTMPAGLEQVAGYGDDGAFISESPRRASAIAFVGNDVYAVDVAADNGADTTELRELALQLLREALD